VIARALTLLPDERLAQLAARGSDPAFAALYNRYSGMLFAYCRSITRNVDDGRDALQNAMIKVLVALRRSPDRSAPIRPWLFCICHNESIGILRRRAAAERVADAAEWTTAAGADEQALEREQVKEVVADVQQLPTGQRAALVMRELADLRYDEIALALETTEGNARQLVFAARAGLKDSRAGRGLPCDTVRDQLSRADARVLRRRSVRAHLRTCDGCREFADSIRRRPAAALFGWPVAAYELIASVFRTAAPARTAAVAAAVATGIGAADVATMKPEHTSTAEARAPAKPATVTTRPRQKVPAVATVDHAPQVRVVAAAYSAPVRHTATTRLAVRKPAKTATTTPRETHRSADPAPRPRAQPLGEARTTQTDCNGATQQQQPQQQREQVRFQPREEPQHQQPGTGPQ
jgi:RNA polymerase sigma factor (sigma-70 family)